MNYGGYSQISGKSPTMNPLIPHTTYINRCDVAINSVKDPLDHDHILGPTHFFLFLVLFEGIKTFAEKWL